ncbi:unnamed protein product [Chrysoparadoxa australica]
MLSPHFMARHAVAEALQGMGKARVGPLQHILSQSPPSRLLSGEGGDGRWTDESKRKGFGGARARSGGNNSPGRYAPPERDPRAKPVDNLVERYIVERDDSGSSKGNKHGQIPRGQPGHGQGQRSARDEMESPRLQFTQVSMSTRPTGPRPGMEIPIGDKDRRTYPSHQPAPKASPPPHLPPQHPPPARQWSPHTIIDSLNLQVVGQEEVKRCLAVTVHNHMRRAEVNKSFRSLPDGEPDHGYGPDPEFSVPEGAGVGRRAWSSERLTQGRDVEPVIMDKTNVILTGPTGTGKTLLADTLAKCIGVPFVITDATTLTQAGYVGEDVESMLWQLYEASDCNLERCKTGIVYIDEVDKLSNPARSASSYSNGGRDVSGVGVQQALLKMVEGTTVKVPPGGRRKGTNMGSAESQPIEIDTTDILFICGGAFSGLEHIVNNRVDKGSIGFNAKLPAKVKPGAEYEKCLEVEPQDLVEFGLIPEFVGRFAQVCSTKSLDEDDLVRVMTEPERSLLKQVKYNFALNDCDLHIADCALRAIAGTALKKNTGARGLRAIVERMLQDPMFEITKEGSNVTAVYIDAEAYHKGEATYLTGADALANHLEAAAGGSSSPQAESQQSQGAVEYEELRAQG